jgi:hypothetical protein
MPDRAITCTFGHICIHTHIYAYIHTHKYPNTPRATASTFGHIYPHIHTYIRTYLTEQLQALLEISNVRTSDYGLFAWIDEDITGSSPQDSEQVTMDYLHKKIKTSRVRIPRIPISDCRLFAWKDNGMNRERIIFITHRKQCSIIDDITCHSYMDVTIVSTYLLEHFWAEVLST